MKWLLLAASVWVGVTTEYSEDGAWFRLTNTDERAYYCTIQLGDGDTFEKIVYPGRTTAWYPRRGGFSWNCEG